VNARRLGSPLDSVLRLTDAAGTQLLQRRLHGQRRGAGDAPRGLVAEGDASAERQYYLFVGDTQRMGGPEYAYRLRIGAPPRQDLNCADAVEHQHPGGATIPITVHAIPGRFPSNRI
jgi:hypothetical protein